jgi:Alkylmercury lyase
MNNGTPDDTPDTPDTPEASESLDGLDDLDWAVRAFVYRFVVDHEQPPTVAETAALLGLSERRAALSFQRLNRRHALFLDPGTLTIRMAHPFSGIPTDFRVRANGHSYWANCAWDMLGIPTALHADAAIDAYFADAQHSSVTFTIANNQLSGPDAVIHFPLPFQRWYDDLIDT